MSINFDTKNPPDPNDPRILPASMQFTFVRREGRVYIEWNIAEVVRVSGQNEKRRYPYLIRTLISPADARAYAKQLLDAATEAEEL